MNARHPHTPPSSAGSRAPADTGPLSEVVCQKQPDGVLIRVWGEFDYDTTGVLRDALDGLDGERAIIDLSQVTFADTTLLHTLLDARAERELLLVGPLPHHLHLLFDGTDTRHCFTFAPERNHT